MADWSDMAEVAAQPPAVDALGPAPTVDELWERIHGRIDLRLRVVERAALVLLDRSLTDDEVAEAVEEADLLAQWLGLLQLAGAASVCRDVVEILAVPPLTVGTGLQLAALIDDLRAVVHAASAEITAPTESAPSLRVVSGVDAHVDSLMWLLMRRGIRVEHHATALGDLVDVDAILVPAGTAPTVAQTLLALGRERAPEIRRIVLHETTETDTLCRLARFADLVLPRTSAPSVLADEIQQLVMAARVEPDTVVVLGDAKLAGTLGRFGLPSTPVRTPRAAIAMLERGSRTLVIGRGPQLVDPDGLVRLVRTSPGVRDAVIAAVGFEGNEAMRLRQDGADIVADGSDGADAWAMHLKALRSRRLRAGDDQGADSGVVLPWARASVLLERALVVSKRVDTHVAIAVLQFDADMEEAELERVLGLLATEFRQDDIVGRWDERRVVVLLRGAGRRAASARFTTAVRDLEIETSARVGVAEFPVDGLTLTDVLVEATRAIETAEAHRGPRVVSTDWRAVSERAADIVLVEADPTLAGVLGGLFERSGYTTQHFANGADALRHLTDAASPVPRLVVLEMDAPGADGLMVLRALRRGGWMNRLRVLLTTSQVRDGELREAFELGALDVVVKPYATVVLTQRVNRLLEA